MNPLLETWASVGPDHNHLQKPYWTIEQADCHGRSEEGTHNNPCTITTVGQEMMAGCDEGLSYADLELRAAIIAAAPRMLRLHLRNEFVQHPEYALCSNCHGDNRTHAKLCPLDALLTEFGFPTAKSREDARKLIEAMP